MKIAMILDGTVSSDIRVASYAPYLERLGHLVTIHEAAELMEEKRIPIVDLAIFSRPNAYPFVEEYKKRGVRTIADIDDDFWSIPKSHVGYNFVGPGNPRYLSEMERALTSVDHI